MSTIGSGPVPIYNNPPIEPQFYEPSQFFISAITLGLTTTVTTTVSHNYVIGQQVRLIIPANCGSRQLNGTSPYVISIPSVTQVELQLDSTNSNAFIYSTSSTPAQITAIGDINSGPVNTGRTNNQTFIDGSFINISPA